MPHVADVQPGPGLARIEGDRRWTLDGRVHFLADDGIHGVELWKTDGTADGTQRLKDIRPGTDRSIDWCCVRIGDRLLFTADDGTHGVEPWASDGTRRGTRRLGDIATGSASSSPSGFVALDGAFYFAASDGTTGSELWVWRP